MNTKNNTEVDSIIFIVMKVNLIHISEDKYTTALKYVREKFAGHIITLTLQISCV